MQAGLAFIQLSFSEVFAAEPRRILFVIFFIGAITVGSGRVKHPKMAA
jgi:hypothetical protein